MKSELTIKECTLKAYDLMLDTFYLNQVTRVVQSMLRPRKPMDSSVGRKLRILNHQGKVKYSADRFGVYTKLQM